MAIDEPPPAPITTAAPAEPDDLAPPPPPPLAKKKHLQLRITRDKQHCPTVACYKWHMVKQRSRPPRNATIDLAHLGLAPTLREAVDQGKIDLFIDATEQHKTIKGRDTVIFVATSLNGVTPNDTAPQAPIYVEDRP
jgi:hypothetical protein